MSKLKRIAKRRWKRITAGLGFVIALWMLYQGDTNGIWFLLLSFLLLIWSIKEK